MKSRVLIGVPTQEMGRRADFYDYLNALEKPEGTFCVTSHGQSPARNRNQIIERAIEGNFTHIFFVDDDVILPQDALVRLLAHDRDIVCGLYLMRNYPHFPIMFDESYNDGRCKFSFLPKGRAGLVEAVNTGLGCALIKTDVFKKMDKPWIRLGQLEKDHWCDDIDFFNRAREQYGYKLFIDLEIWAGHVISAIIFPNRSDDGSWNTAVTTGDNKAYTVAQVVPTDEEIIKELEHEGVLRSAGVN